MQEAMDTLPDTASRQEKHIRITQHGKMKSWITASLQFLETPEGDKSLTLHTLPHRANIPADAEPPAENEPAPSINPHTASLATSVVPRLISVVEILKREYIKLLDSTKSARAIGLHQYNEFGTLEELGIVVDRTEGTVAGQKADEAGKGAPTADERRSTEIIQALSGKNHPKQLQTPFMRITLSTVERPDLLLEGASYQPPAIRKQSKAAKARAKKQRAKTKRTTGAAASDATIPAAMQ